MTVTADAAPCRHEGAPPKAVVERAAAAIKALNEYPEVLAKFGLSPDEFSDAFPDAVEAVRGRFSASNQTRRDFLARLFTHMVDGGHLRSFATPIRGQDTVYRLEVPNLGSVAVIQKGCPDGAHSSSRWSAPSWADETYIWWLCSSLRSHVGEHVSKGVSRLRQRFASEDYGDLTGVIFHNELCGTAKRACPKQGRAVVVDGLEVPPPCIYVMPKQVTGTTKWNWQGERRASFPEVLLATFGISRQESSMFTSFIGFEARPSGALRTGITNRFGIGRSTSYRS